MHTLAEAITRQPVPWNRGRPYHIAVATFDPLYPNLVGRKDLAPANVAALLDWLKGPGSGATFGTAGVFAVSDLCGRLLADAAGIKLTWLPTGAPDRL